VVFQGEPQNSRLIVVNGTEVDVVVCKDMRGLFGPRFDLWLTYDANSQAIEKWLSRVLLASGAGLGRCVMGCRHLFYSPSASAPLSHTGLERLADVKALGGHPDKVGLLVSRRGVAVHVFSGSSIDPASRQIRPYVAIDYGWRLFRRSELGDLVTALSDELLATGYVQAGKGGGLEKGSGGSGVFSA
jgi:hypothetical protein